MAEIAQTQDALSFKRWLGNSPHTVQGLQTEAGLEFSSVILSSKDDESKKIMEFNVANDVALKNGDIILWPENSEIEHWLLFKKKKKVNEGYQTFYGIRCNYLLKWVDEDGNLQQSWCYFVSSLDSKIKENFRLWHSAVVAQPNKYAEIIIPSARIMRHTRFIVEDEGWKLVEDDHSSVPGITYLSFEEEKVNQITDDINNDIADTDKLAQYAIIVPDTNYHCALNDTVQPLYTITKNGVPITAEVIMTSQDLTIIDKNMIAISEGATAIEIKLKDKPEICCLLNVEVDGVEMFNAYIEGSDSIKLGRKNTYRFINNNEAIAVFSLESTDLVKIVSLNENECILQANEKNKLGTVKLIASCNDNIYEKQIKVTPLW